MTEYILNASSMYRKGHLINLEISLQKRNAFIYEDSVLLANMDRL